MLERWFVYPRVESSQTGSSDLMNLYHWFILTRQLISREYPMYHRMSSCSRGGYDERFGPD